MKTYDTKRKVNETDNEYRDRLVDMLPRGWVHTAEDIGDCPGGEKLDQYAAHLKEVLEKWAQ